MDIYPEIRINQDPLAYNEVELMRPAVIFWPNSLLD